ncbi:MAG: tripartite tricarboxylate transporter substrate binding protein [Polynucleobacter sp.]|nr:MAG: tripartite tricarboxylate transporter substrate binding protein [Polynucleobacter sp.]
MNSHKKRQFLLKSVTAFVLCVSLSPVAYAQATQSDKFPSKPVKLIVPFSPGGGTDIITRTLGQAMAQDLGQSVIVENKPGAGTMIGTDFVAKSPADGYTLVMATIAHTINPSIQAKLPYSQNDSFAPVSLIGVSPNVLVVKPDSPYKSVKDILAAAKAKPGTLTFASQGSGTSAHLAGELFKYLSKTDLVHIPYKGAGPALTDVMGGQVDMMFATAAAVSAFLESGKLRAIAVTTSARSASPSLAKYPTIAESGIPGYEASSWYGFLAPAGTPKPVIARLNAATKKATQSEAFKKRVEGEGLTVRASGPEEFDKFLKAEEERWKVVVKSAGIKAE